MRPNFFIKPAGGMFLYAALFVFCQTALAQTPPSLPDTSKMTYNQLSTSLKLYVFPAKGQNQQQQKADESECYKWAMQQSGIDPQNLPVIKPTTPEKTGPDGGAVKGAAKGAAAGVAIGAIAGDAGEGAAIGAVVGGVGGRRKAKQAKKQEQQQAQAEIENKEKEMIGSFTKGFSACLEGKGYTIK